MKIGVNFLGFNISAEGLSIQRKKMNLISENIANADTTRTSDGQPYRRKFLSIFQKQSPVANNLTIEQPTLKLNVSEADHIPFSNFPASTVNNQNDTLISKENTDTKPGDIVYMPDHPDANEQGYVEMSNVNIITEMVDMIAATRSYESNLTALNASKQMAKDSLEI